MSTDPLRSPVDSNDVHFRTDHLLPNLKQRTVKSGAVTVASQVARIGLNMVSIVVLARLLTPSDFGLVAMVTSVTGLLRVFKEAGLSIATVQREEITHAQVSNMFWINIAVSLASTAIIAGISPLLVWYYGDERLLGIALALSLTFFFSGSAVQHQALLRRQMRFKSLAWISIISTTIGVAIAILMAYFGFGYWSLVGMNVAMEVAVFALTWTTSRWRPQLPRRNSGTRPLIRFGAARTVGDFLLALSRGSDNLLIGRVWGADAVGLYSRASALLLTPLRQFLFPINAVFVPALSRLQSQPDRYRSVFLNLYAAIALGSFYFSGLLLGVAKPLTLVLLGARWVDAALIFAGFTFAALCIPLANASAWLFTTQGRAKNMLAAQSIYAGATIVSFLVGLPFGPIGVATAFSVSNLLVRLPIYYSLAGRAGPVSTSDLWLVFFRHLPVWLVTLAASWGTRQILSDQLPLLELTISLVAGATAGGLTILAVPAYREMTKRVFVTIYDSRRKNSLNK